MLLEGRACKWKSEAKNVRFVKFVSSCELCHSLTRHAVTVHCPASPTNRNKNHLAPKCEMWKVTKHPNNLLVCVSPLSCCPHNRFPAKTIYWVDGKYKPQVLYVLFVCLLVCLFACLFVGLLVCLFVCLHDRYPSKQFIEWMASTNTNFCLL